MFHVQTHGRSPSTRVFAYKSPITGETTEFYPEKGLVTIEGAHYKTGAPYYKREGLREFLIRAAALSLELKHMEYSGERRALQRCVEVMVDAARAAKEQGNPFDPRHMRDMVNARPARLAVGMRGGRAGADPLAFDPGMPAMPAARADAPYVPLGGEVTTPGRLIIAGR